jgi:hypothetical protein
MQNGSLFKREPCHRGYCLEFQVKYIEVRAFIRQVLRHPALRTQAQRMGQVVCVLPGGLDCRQAGKDACFSVTWGAKA